MIFVLNITPDQVGEIAAVARILNERDPVKSPYANDQTDQDRILTTFMIGKIFAKRAAERGTYL